MIVDPKNGSRFSKEYSLTGFKKYPFSNLLFPFRNYNTLLQMPNGTSVTTLSDFNNLTPAALSNHKKFCSMKIKVYRISAGLQRETGVKL